MKSLKKYKDRKVVESKVSKPKVNDRGDFFYELNLINNDYLRAFAEFCVDNALEMFLTYPASKSGDFHPDSSNGYGGLVRHTKLCMRLANEMMKDNYLFPFDELEKDLVMVALLLHDFSKFGWNGVNTFMKHGCQAVRYIEHITKGTEFEVFMFSEEWEIISNAMRTHLGVYSEQFVGLPKDRVGKMVARVDYISSLKTFDEMTEIKKIENNEKNV